MSEILKLALDNLTAWPAASVAIVAIICATIMACVKYADRITAFLKYWDERQRSRELHKIQGKCQHKWAFEYPYRYGECCLCGLKASVNMIASYYPDQAAVFMKYLNIKVMEE